VGFFQFSSVSQLRGMCVQNIQLNVGEGEPSFEEFLASPAVMRLGSVSIKPYLGPKTLLPACYFSMAMLLQSCRLSCLVSKSFLSLSIKTDVGHAHFVGTVFKSFLVLFDTVVSLTW
jgi:hypothetical protein